MRVTVCFKTMADPAMMAAQDWRADDSLQVETGFVRRMFNCFEESALELALRLAEHQTETASSPELTALTVDDDRAELWLRLLYAVGYHRAVRIEPPAGVDLRFAPGQVARLIAAQVRESGQPDLILTGIRSGEGDNRQTGPLLAEELGWPCLSNVVAAAPAETPGSLTVTSLRNGDRLSRTIRTPAVLTVGNAADLPSLGQPTIKQRLLVKSRPVEVIPVANLGFEPNSFGEGQGRLISLDSRGSDRRGELISGQDQAEKINSLFKNHLQDRLGR